MFEETGFLEARITDIADRAGLSHGSFYHYFESKEQAFREVAEAQEALLTASDEAGDAEDDTGTGNDANPETAHDADAQNADTAHDVNARNAHTAHDADAHNADAAEDASTDGPGTGYSDAAASTVDNAVDGPVADLTAGPAAEIERIRRANRRYLERYRDNGRIMGVIEEVSRYDDHVNDARMRRQKHFADRAEQAIRRLQADGLADAQVDPEIAALALGSMMGRFAELWLVEEWGDFDFDDTVDQMTRLWANAIGLHDEAAPAPAPATPTQAKATPARRGRAATGAPGGG